MIELKSIFYLVVLLAVSSRGCEPEPLPSGVPSVSGNWSLESGSEGAVSLDLRLNQSVSDLTGIVQGVLRSRYHLSLEGQIVDSTVIFNATNLMKATGRLRSGGKILSLDIETKDDGSFSVILQREENR